MPLEIIGEHPLARNEAGELKSRIGTIFVEARVLVTLPGIHATQRLTYLDLLNRRRVEAGQAALSDSEQDLLFRGSVDLIMENNEVLIRPDPENMDLAFRGDDLLQEYVPKHRIKYLYARSRKVKDAIKRRGEYWRISPLPESPDEMKGMIALSRIAIGGQAIYFYNKGRGTRLLTYNEFCRLSALDDDRLRAHLVEIRDYSGKRNRMGNPEVDFFMTEKFFSAGDFAQHDFAAMEGGRLREAHAALQKKFGVAVGPEYQVDDAENTPWRNKMFAALMEQKEDVIAEEVLTGLSTDFFMQIEWLPGARIEEGELLFDPVFEERQRHPDDTDLARLCDEKTHGFIFNLIREYGDLEYVNLGRMSKSLSRRPMQYGRRDAYTAELRQRGADKDTVRILRMQKWGVWEHLDEGKSLLDAILESEEYTDFILDRRFGCGQLGMNLPPRVTTRKITERYCGIRKEYQGITVWTPYFERDYIYGTGSNKLPNYRFEDEAFALSFARLLGEAAAPNMILGRIDLDGKVVFDAGNEVVIIGAAGLPAEIIVADHTGAFRDYLSDLGIFAPDYATPVNRRLEYLKNRPKFADIYLSAFVERFAHIQSDYRKRKRAFDSLFKHRQRHEGGSFSYRWEKVLERLNKTDPVRIRDLIAGHITAA